MTVNPPMTLRSTAALVFICGAILASVSAQEAPSGRSEAGESQKLEPALKFWRARSAGLGGHHSKRNRRSELCQERRTPAMDDDSRRRPREPVHTRPACRSRRSAEA